MVSFRNFIELVKFGQLPNTGVEVEVELLQVSSKVALQDHIWLFNCQYNKHIRSYLVLFGLFLFISIFIDEIYVLNFGCIRISIMTLSTPLRTLGGVRSGQGQPSRETFDPTIIEN